MALLNPTNPTEHKIASTPAPSTHNRMLAAQTSTHQRKETQSYCVE